MLSEKAISLLETLKLNPGASRVLIDRVVQRIGTMLPADYLELVNRANGGQGFVGGNGGYIELWPIEEIPEVYFANQIGRHAPGMFPFASYGGGNVYAFDQNTSSSTIVEVPLIGISRRNVRVLADSIENLLIDLAKPI